MVTIKIKSILILFLLTLFGFCQLATAATIEVTNTNDSDPPELGSLRWAMSQANGTDGHDTIVFSNPPFDPNNPATIILDTTLPPLSLTDTAGTTIEGNGGVIIVSSERHAVADCIEIKSSNNVIRGLQIYGFHGGIVFHRYSTTGNNTIGGTQPSHRNVVSDNVHIGIALDGQNCSGNQVIGNYIGTNADGTAKYFHDGSEPGLQATGVDIAHGAHDNFVGGPTPSHRNIISGNSFTGVGISATTAATEGVTRNNHIQGNYIGTDHTGTQAIPNESAGVGIGFSAGGNIIEGNVISGQTGTDQKHGIRLHMGELGIAGTQIVGNIIGLTADATDPLPNGIGIYGEANDTVIGGPDPTNEANIISGNLDRGIWVGGTGIQIEGNYIGTNANGSPNLGNRVGIRISGQDNRIGPNNYIWSNTDHGILLDGADTIQNMITQNSITENGDGNPERGIILSGGAQAGIVPPTILSVSTNQVLGEVDLSVADGSIVEIFQDEGDQGKVFVGSANVSGGNFAFNGYAPPDGVGGFLTATVRDLDNNTSEFSDPVTNNLQQEPSLTPQEQIAAIIDFYDEGVQEGGIIGTSNFAFVNRRFIRSMRTSLLWSRFFIDWGIYQWACLHLDLFSLACDGSPVPLFDFITGESVPELREKIEILETDLGCP